jgi:hypothetical protein
MALRWPPPVSCIGLAEEITAQADARPHWECGCFIAFA